CLNLSRPVLEEELDRRLPLEASDHPTMPPRGAALATNEHDRRGRSSNNPSCACRRRERGAHPTRPLAAPRCYKQWSTSAILRAYKTPRAQRVGRQEAQNGCVPLPVTRARPPSVSASAADGCARGGGAGRSVTGAAN